MAMQPNFQAGMPQTPYGVPMKQAQILGTPYPVPTTRSSLPATSRTSTQGIPGNPASARAPVPTSPGAVYRVAGAPQSPPAVYRQAPPGVYRAGGSVSLGMAPPGAYRAGGPVSLGMANQRLSPQPVQYRTLADSTPPVIAAAPVEPLLSMPYKPPSSVATRMPESSTDVVLQDEAPEAEFAVDMDVPTTVVLFGATGDLARKKLYPALYQLMFGAPDAPKIPQHSYVVGYGRSAVDLPKMLAKQAVNVKGERREEFLARCSYFAGAYDKEESFAGLHEHLSQLEGGGKANRIFFFSVPPTVFADVAKGINKHARAPHGGATRVIMEKPFGRDSRTFAELNAVTSAIYDESELFRIDHYLGKEVVLNMVALRFGNQIFEGLWNRNNIESVQIVFKENLGTGGRGGYFDGFGIIRDIMQNHLLQVLLWFAMEPPSSLTRANVQKEKVKLLKAIKTLGMSDVFLGQFGENVWLEDGKEHKEPGYLDDETVPAGSRCATYAAVALEINNDRWKGVPFMMRAGKGLDERMAEVRVTFKKKSFNALVPGSANELVMRIQPDEAIYLKVMNKVPGWDQKTAAPVVLDMSYKNSFDNCYVCDAYERMFLNAAKGDGTIFVGQDELVEAWRIFTPLLDEIDKKKPQPVIYPFGARDPHGMDEFAQKYGITLAENWEERLVHSGMLDNIENLFRELDVNNTGELHCEDLKKFARMAFEGREPNEKQLKQIFRMLDVKGHGYITLEEMKQGVAMLSHAFVEEHEHDHAHDYFHDHDSMGA